jgi:hypothetical protein
VVGKCAGAKFAAVWVMGNGYLGTHLKVCDMYLLLSDGICVGLPLGFMHKHHCTGDLVWRWDVCKVSRKSSSSPSQKCMLVTCRAM